MISDNTAILSFRRHFEVNVAYVALKTQNDMPMSFTWVNDIPEKHFLNHLFTPAIFHDIFKILSITSMTLNLFMTLMR